MMTPAKGPTITLAGIFLLPVLLILCACYYFTFASDLTSYDGEAGLFQYALNSHDHLVYVQYMEKLSSGEIEGYEFNNDVGIATIYNTLAWALPFLVDQNYSLLALVFNCATLIGCYTLYADIGKRLGLGFVGQYSFFANIYFIYFAQLINKDMLTVLVFLLAVHCGIRRKLLLLMLLIPLFALVRQQLALFALIFCLLMATPKPKWRIVGTYIVTSVTAGILSVFVSIIGEESLGEGFSAYLIDFNRDYYVGYLLFNPIRLIQYIADAYASFMLGTETNGWDVAKLLRWPQLIVVLMLARPMSQMLTRFSAWQGTPARSLTNTVVAYVLVWLMNPTINARYVMLITPVLVLFALYARRHPPLPPCR